MSFTITKYKNEFKKNAGYNQKGVICYVAHHRPSPSEGVRVIHDWLNQKFLDLIFELISVVAFLSLFH